MPLLFAVTLFVSAFLLFLVQPMLGKMILPRLGGTPAVWNTCMVFFQAVLLAGYAYTHTVSTWLPVRRQLLLQCLLLGLPLLFLPFVVGQWAPPTESNPVLALLLLLLLVVGIPFFVVATSAPLLQKWFASTGHPSARDPYFLYGASNLGSMLALIAYPLLVEPNLPVLAQSWLWAGAYALFIALTLACGAVVWLAPPAVVVAGAPVAGTADPAWPAPQADADEAIRPAKKNRQALRTVETPVAPAPKAVPSTEVTPLRRLRWIGLAAAPSSLMLGVTTYLTTDIAAIPLFWIVPLALYLLSFILVFTRWPVEWTGRPHAVVVALQPLALLVLVLIDVGDVSVSQRVAFAINLIVFFLTALLCHGELARDRPSTRYLTEFFLWMSVGGVLGGLFNALVGPLVFDRHVEYVLVLALGCLLRPPTNYLALLRGRLTRPAPSTAEDYFLDVGYAVCLGLLTFALLRIGSAKNFWGEAESFRYWLAVRFEKSELFGGGNARVAWRNAVNVATGVSVAVISGIPLLTCLVFSGRPLRFGLCAVAFFLANGFYTVANERPALDEEGNPTKSGTLYTHRSFFGTQRVRYDIDRKLRYYTLIHGGIDHGRQFADPEKRDQSITYFHPTGPVGQVFTAFGEMKEHPPYAVVGLGIGTLASYGKKGQQVRFYEIDPAVKHLSLPPEGEKRYFHYLHDAIHKRGVDLKVLLGDGRLKLQEAEDGAYQIIVLDAFSSDAIPMHLLTLEAMDLYLKKLKDGGLMIFNVTNRYVNLTPMLADLAHERDLLCLYHGDDAEGIEAKFPSDWVVVAKKRTDRTAIATEAMHAFGAAVPLGGPAAVPWATVGRAARMDLHPLLLKLDWSLWKSPKRGHKRIWTDDYSNLLSVLNW